MNLNFKISELIHSDLAIQNNIDNLPDINALDNMLELIFNCLQPIRDLIKKPIIVTSGYRNQQINFLAGGAFNSQHKEGKAADFIIKGMTPKQIIEIIKNSNIEYDQLIDERTWVHISFNKGNNRKQILRK